MIQHLPYFPQVASSLRSVALDPILDLSEPGVQLLEEESGSYPSATITTGVERVVVAKTAYGGANDGTACTEIG